MEIVHFFFLSLNFNIDLFHNVARRHKVLLISNRNEDIVISIIIFS